MVPSMLDSSGLWGWWACGLGPQWLPGWDEEVGIWWGWSMSNYFLYKLFLRLRSLSSVLRILTVYAQPDLRHVSGCDWSPAFSNEHFPGLELAPWLPFSLDPLRGTWEASGSGHQLSGSRVVVLLSSSALFHVYRVLSSATKGPFSQWSPLRELRQAFLPISQMKKLNSKMKSIQKESLKRFWKYIREYHSKYKVSWKQKKKLL